MASGSRPDSVHEPNGEQFTEAGPSFTAVNGSNSPAPSHKVRDQPKESKEDSSRPLAPSDQNEQGKGSGATGPTQEQVNINQHERRPSPPPQERAEDRPPQHYPHPPEGIHDLQNNHAHQPSNTPQPNSSNNNGNNGAQKRKREYPDDYDQPSHGAYHSHGLPPSPQRQRMYPQDNGPARERDHGPPDNYGRPERGAPPELYPRPERSPPQAENYPQPERHSLVRNEYDNRGDGSIAPGRPYYSEARMAEALQRENNSYEPMPMHESQFGSPDDDDDHPHAQHYGDYGGPPRTQAQREMDRTRRKRVFSNRTKTGCMTCRRRKKKCDEQHPECKSNGKNSFTSGRLSSLS